jgi:hypothetical protein
VNAEPRRGGCLGSGAESPPGPPGLPPACESHSDQGRVWRIVSGEHLGRLASFGDATSHEDAEGVRFGGELAIEAPRAREHPNIRETRGRQ